MLRLPSLRWALEDLRARQPLDSLFEAYEDVAVTLDRLRRDGRVENADLLSEYESMRMEIEADVIADCSSAPGLVS